jgi:hypothetical protein
VAVAASRDWDWHSFIFCADEWFVAYASLPPTIGFLSVKLFLLGHTTELYLKAAYVRMFADVPRAIKFGHDIKNIFNACKSHDSAFLYEYELRDHILQINFLDCQQIMKLPRDDQMHFIKNQNLYVIAKHQQDLKYIGLPWKTLPVGRRSFVMMGLDPYWIKFFRTIRSYLGYPNPPHADRIMQYLNIGGLPDAAVVYLRGLYG